MFHAAATLITSKTQPIQHPKRELALGVSLAAAHTHTYILTPTLPPFLVFDERLGAVSGIIPDAPHVVGTSEGGSGKLH